MHLWRQTSSKSSIRLRSRKKSYQERPLRLFKSPTLDHEDLADAEAKLSEGHHSLVHEHSKHRPELPLFQRHAESTPGELFYDLFFIANLSTFTGKHEVIKANSISNYIGFFCIIWFTWFQVALFDVRFSRDSVFDRVCKVAQFGVQIGFSFIAATFELTETDVAPVADGQAVSLLLMVSRLVLAVQYTSLGICLRRYPESRVVWLMVTASLVAAAIYLGVSFHFTSASSTFIAWFLVSVVETLAHIGIASKERYFGFKGTHLVERMSLMTLIVLGEGIIALASAITQVWALSEYYPGLGAAVVSVMLLIYAIYMLYFDTLAQEHFGTIRQQLWALLHLPLHMALVLFDEGTKQFVIFNAANQQSFEFLQLYTSVPAAAQLFYGPFEFTSDQNTTEFFASQSEGVLAAFANFTALPPQKLNMANFDTAKLHECADRVKDGVDIGWSEVFAALSDFSQTVAEGIGKSFGIELSASDLAGSLSHLFSLVFVYFYVSVGVALLVMLALWIVSKRSKHDWFDYLRFAAWALVGLGLCLLALIALTASDPNGVMGVFMGGNWLLPTPMIVLLALSVLFHLPFGRNA